MSCKLFATLLEIMQSQKQSDLYREQWVATPKLWMTRRKIIQRTISVLEEDACVLHLDPSDQEVSVLYPQHGHRVSLWAFQGLWSCLSLWWRVLRQALKAAVSSREVMTAQGCSSAQGIGTCAGLRQTWEKMTWWNSVEMYFQKTMKGPQSDRCSGSLLWGWPCWFPEPGKQQDSFGFEDSERFAHFHLLSSLQATRPVQLKDRFSKHRL